MRILVTGGNGFLGYRLAQSLLEKGHAVRVFGRSAAKLEAAESFQGDIGDLQAVNQAVKGCDAVFHTAAKVGMGRQSEFFRVNVVGARNIVSACRRAGVKALIYTSTPSVVFEKDGIRGADERHPYGPYFLCDYARTKAQAEQETLAQADDKLRICALRPHLIYGAGDPHLLPAVVAAAESGRLRQVGDGKNRVDITHIANAVLAHELALKALLEGRANKKAYFISQGEPVLLWPWINQALSKVGIAPVSRKIPYRLAYLLGWLCELFFKGKSAPPMTRFVAANLAHDHFYDISAARKDLGYAPVVSIEDGLDDWAQSFLREKA